MAVTRIAPHQIEAFCRYHDNVIVVLAARGRFQFCGRTLLKAYQCDLEGVTELSPEAFLKRYPDLPQPAVDRLRELIGPPPTAWERLMGDDTP